MARRMVSETTIKNKQGEVIINNAMTVAKNGDVVVGKNLEVDGTLTVGGEPITPGGGGKLYAHHVSLTLGESVFVELYLKNTVDTEATSIEEVNQLLKTAQVVRIGSFYTSTTSNGGLGVAQDATIEYFSGSDNTEITAYGLFYMSSEITSYANGTIYGLPAISDTVSEL